MSRQLCGGPAAWVGRIAASLVPGVAATLTLTLPRMAVAQVPAVLTGLVRAEDDNPVYGARVSVRTAGADGTVRPTVAPAQDVLTGDGGNFRFAAVTAGWAQVIVRRLGFRPETLTVEVPQPAGGRVVVPLQRVSQALSTVVVRATVARGPFAAFERRRASGFGRFVTRADIERRRPQHTTDMLRNVPGVTIERSDAGTSLPRFRNATVGFTGAPCYPVFWLDGTPLGPSLDLDALSPGAIEGMELYSGIATVPAALRAGSTPGTCGVVAVWTRQGEARPSRATSSADADAIAGLVTAGRAFTADQVDVPALPMPNAGPAPAYPDSLRTARASGRVVVEFVVDEVGQLDESTLGVVSATHPAFADAVRAAMLGVRFSPAVRRGRAVRQVVHLPVLFDLERGPRVSAPAPVSVRAASVPRRCPPSATDSEPHHPRREGRAEHPWTDLARFGGSPALRIAAL